MIPEIFPLSPTQNVGIVVTDVAGRSPFSTLAVDSTPDIHLCATTDTFQVFPFYRYNDDGTNRRENITEWALEQFRSHYADKSIAKWDIFHYVYAVLHHPEYRERYAANLRRELPRIPFVSANSVSPAPVGDTPQSPGSLGGRSFSSDINPATSPGVSTPEAGPSKDLKVFRAFAKTGKRLAEIHVHYEDQPEYKLKKIEKPGKKLDYYVTKMRLSKDKTQIVCNDFLTLSGIPPETFEYRLGNRSALDWVCRLAASRPSTSSLSNVIESNVSGAPETFVIGIS